MKLSIKLFNNNTITQDILKQVEEIGANEDMLPIYYESESLYNELLVNNSYLLIINNEDNILLSFTIYTISDDNSIHIKSICIDSRYKRYKLGSHMLSYLKSKHHMITLYVQCVNLIAFNFYKKNNFKVIEEVTNYYDTLKDKNAYYMSYN